MSNKGIQGTSGTGTAGIAEWRASVIYDFEALVKRDGNIFSSTQNLNFNSDPLTNTQVWRRIGSRYSPLLFGTGASKGGEISIVSSTLPGTSTVIHDSISNLIYSNNLVQNNDFAVLGYTDYDYISLKDRKTAAIFSIATGTFAAEQFLSPDTLSVEKSAADFPTWDLNISRTSNVSAAFWQDKTSGEVFISVCRDLALGFWDAPILLGSGIDFENINNSGCLTVNSTHVGVTVVEEKSTDKLFLYVLEISSGTFKPKIEIDPQPLDVENFIHDLRLASNDEEIFVMWLRNVSGTESVFSRVYNISSEALTSIQSDYFNSPYQSYELGCVTAGGYVSIFRDLFASGSTPYTLTSEFYSFSSGSYFFPIAIDTPLRHYDVWYGENRDPTDPLMSITWNNRDTDVSHLCILSKSSPVPIFSEAMIASPSTSFTGVHSFSLSTVVFVLTDYVNKKLNKYVIDYTTGTVSKEEDIAPTGEDPRRPFVATFDVGGTVESLIVYKNTFLGGSQLKYIVDAAVSVKFLVSGGEGLIQGKKVAWLPLEFTPSPDPLTTYYTYIDQNSTFLYQTTPLTATQARENIFLGSTRTDASGNFFTVETNPHKINISNETKEMAAAVGGINLEGNMITHIPDSAQGTFSISAGSLFRLGSNSSFANPNNPNVLSFQAQVPLSFSYAHVTSPTMTEIFPASTDVDFSNFSDNGVLSSVGNSNFSIQRVYIRATSLERVSSEVLILYGSLKYPSQSDAMDGILKENPPLPDFISNFLLRAYVVAEGNSLSPVVKITRASKFGERLTSTLFG
jgi:hypothetical protein